MTTPYIDPNLIFAENAPVQDKPAAFQNYDKGWDASRNNDGRPLIPQMNYLTQQADLKNLYIHENGAALPYKEGIAYEENAVVVKDGVLQQWESGTWVVVGGDKLSKSSNLSDLTDLQAALTNLGFQQNLTGTGYQKLPSGLIFQWGYASLALTGTTVTFPVAFPNACLNVQITDDAQVGNKITPVAVTALSKNNFIGWAADIPAPSTASSTFWFATGY